jgi:hypothetical protein
MSLEYEAMQEIAQLFFSHPTPEQIIAFHASPTLSQHLYALIAAEKAGTISADDRRQLDKFEAIEHLVIHLKAQALQQLRKRAS